MKTARLGGLAAAALLGVAGAAAQAPDFINYQGRLLVGTSLVNGAVGLTLRLHDADAGGSLLYADSNAVTVVDGLYSTLLGDNTVFGNLDQALANGAVWLEAVVNGIALSPREPVAAVPYARVVHGLAVATNGSVVLNPDGGGNAVDASAEHATVGGGFNNLVDASASYATIAGGVAQHAGGIASAVLGGSDCDAANTLSMAGGNRAKAGNVGAFVWADSQNFDFPSTATDQFNVRAVGGTRIVSGIDGTGAVTSGVELAAGSGSWASLSDVRAKDNFRDVDPGAILARVAAMPVREWNYRTQDAAVRHLGPTAQDFHAAFGLGTGDRTITAVDADGVSLAAIQALARENADLKVALQSLRARVEHLEAGRPEGVECVDR